jgi:hypothetical protein
MATLRLISITCIEMNDHFGNDDVYIRLDGKLFQEPLQMRPGDTIQFGPRRVHEFDGEAVLELWEQDPGEHDHLGTHRITIEETAKGEQSVRFRPERGYYELVYAVN